MATMKAVVKTEPGYDKMEFRDVEIPKATDDKVLIEVAYTGICGSDIHTFKGEYKNPATPVTLGHEFSGTVAEVGEDVTKVKVGDRVTSETTFTTCGHCRYCQSKDYNLCSNRKGIGTQQNGSMAKYVLSREESVHVLPENVSLKSASMTEPLACTTHPLMEIAPVEDGDTVLIVGPGPIGLLAAQVAKAAGATVIMSGITQDQHRLDLGLELGVDYVIDSQKDDLAEFVFSKTDGYGADKVYECSGSAYATNEALKVTAKKGYFVQVGMFPTETIDLDVNTIQQHEIRYIGCRSQKPSSWDKAIDLLESGKVDAEALVTKVYPLDQWREAFEAVMSGEEIKVLLES